MPAPEVQMLFPGLSRLKSGADIVLRGVSHRAELAALESVDLRRHATVAGILFALATTAFALAGLAATLLVAAIFWDTPHRVTALASLVGIEVLTAVGAMLGLRHRWKNCRPWAATREQLHHDAQCLREILQTPRS